MKSRAFRKSSPVTATIMARIDIDARLDVESLSQEELEVSTITLYQSEVGVNRGHLIAVNAEYICYAIRGERMRRRRRCLRCTSPALPRSATCRAALRRSQSSPQWYHAFDISLQSRVQVAWSARSTGPMRHAR